MAKRTDAGSEKREMGAGLAGLGGFGGPESPAAAGGLRTDAGGGETARTDAGSVSAPAKAPVVAVAVRKEQHAITCPRCKGPHVPVAGGTHQRVDAITRYRKCSSCGHRFATEEHRATGHEYVTTG